MEESRGSVRIGPISLFVLIIVLCLAVLAVLSLQTARAQQAITTQQALMIEETYANEVAGQQFVADVDALLSQGKRDGLSYDEVFGRIVDFANAQSSQEGLKAGLESEVNPAAVPSAAEGEHASIIRAEFLRESGRKLVVRLQIDPDLTYTIASWLVSTQWVEPGADIVYWQG